MPSISQIEKDEITRAIDNIQLKLNNEKLSAADLVDFFWATCSKIVQELNYSAASSDHNQDEQALQAAVKSLCFDVYGMDEIDAIDWQKLIAGDNSEITRFIEMCFNIWESEARSSKSINSTKDGINHTAGKTNLKSVRYSPRTLLNRQSDIKKSWRNKLRQIINDRWSAKPPQNNEQKDKRLINAGLAVTGSLVDAVSPSFARRLRHIEMKRSKLAHRNAVHAFKVQQIKDKKKAVDNTIATYKNKIVKRNKEKDFANEQMRKFYEVVQTTRCQEVAKRLREKESENISH